MISVSDATAGAARGVLYRDRYTGLHRAVQQPRTGFALHCIQPRYLNPGNPHTMRDKNENPRGVASSISECAAEFRRSWN